MKKGWVFLLVISLILVAGDVMAQCPMCKTALSSARDNGSQVGSSLNNGILYLLALPYTVITVFGIIWYRNMKQRKKQGLA